MKLPENIDINKYTIELKEGKQLLYGPIYALSLIGLETLKIHIKTYLQPRFILPSKSFAGILILFDKKINNSLYFCVSYQKFNNLINKTENPLL